MPEILDLLVVGAGAAGLSAAAVAAKRGLSVGLVESADRIGGTLEVAGGHMSAAGTRVQAGKGIVDSAELHLEDVMRISQGTANRAMVWKAVSGAADTLHWLLDNGLELEPDHPVIYHGHESYQIPRTYWGVQGGLSLLSVLRRLVDAEVARGALDLRLDSRMTAISPGSDRIGVTVLGSSGESVIMAGSVLLTTGGFAANRAMLARFSGGAAPAPGGHVGAQGGGHEAALAIGGQIVNEHTFLPSHAVVEDPEGGGAVLRARAMPHLRPPWEIYVNRQGRRYVGEDITAYDLRDRRLREQPDITFWAVWDAAIHADAPPLFPDLAAGELDALFDRHPLFYRADSLVALATKADLDGAGLAETVNAYNASVISGVDALGRTYMPAKIVTAPFYAVRMSGLSALSFAGLAVDESLRVLDSDGRPIPGLYAAGEILGHGLLNGQAFAGGMAVTPALTFGRILGETIRRWRPRERRSRTASGRG